MNQLAGRRHVEQSATPTSESLTGHVIALQSVQMMALDFR